MASASPPRSSSQSRRRRLSSPATASTTSTIARCSPRNIRSSGVWGIGPARRSSGAGSASGSIARPTALATYGTAVRSGAVPGHVSIGIATRRPTLVGTVIGKAAAMPGSGEKPSRSNHRRSPGPPRAGSAGLVTKASCDSVSDLRGSASRVTVTRISRRGERLPRTTIIAAPVAAPRRSPRARKASSLAVTRGQGPRCPAPPGAPSLPASVAASSGHVNPRARSAEASAPAPLREPVVD